MKKIVIISLFIGCIHASTPQTTTPQPMPPAPLEVVPPTPPDPVQQLSDAINRNDINQVKKGLEMPGFDINSKDAQGNTILMIAVKAGYPELVRMVLAKNPNVNEKTPIIQATDPNLPNFGAETALMFAVQKKSEPIIKLLLNNNADANSANPRGETVLMYAVKTGIASMVKMILEKKPTNINARTIKGQSALDIAREQKLKEIEEMLIKAGAQ